MSTDYRTAAEEAITTGEAAFFTGQIPSIVVPGIEFARANALGMLALVDAVNNLAGHLADANGIALAGLGPDARITFLTKQEEHRA